MSYRPHIPGEHLKPRAGNFLNLAVPSPARHSRSLGPSFLIHVNSTAEGNSQSSPVRGELRPPPCCPIHCGSTPPSEPPNPPGTPFTYRSGWQPSRGENHDTPVNAIHSEPTNSDLVLLIHLGCAVTVGQPAPGVPEPLSATSPPKLEPLSLTASLTTVHTNT